MLDQLLKSAEGPLMDILGQVDQEKASQSAGVIKEQVLLSLQEQVKSGDLSALTEMFSGKETSSGSAAVNKLEGNVSQSLMDRLGIDSATAMKMASVAIPLLMNMFNKKVNDAPQANNDIMSTIAKSLQGDGVGGADILGSLLGGSDGKGGMDLGGLMNMGKSLFK